MYKVLFLFMLPLFFISSSATDIGLPPGKRPLKLKALLYIADLDTINTSEQSFEARIFYRVRWHDRRLAHKGKTPISKPLSEIWNPGIQIINQQKAWKTFPDVVKITPDGHVTYLQGMWGSFSQPLKLQLFPFDKQKISCQLLAVGNYSTDDVQFTPDDGEGSGIADELSIADWKISDWEVSLKPFKPSNLSPVPAIKFSVTAKRRTLYYVAKMILPLVMIVMMSWAVFWMDPLNVGSNVGISITSMLTLIAYRFSADTILPRLSYLTSLDYFILASTILVFLSLGQNLTTSALAKRKKMEQAHKLDVICRYAFPLVFVFIILETMVFRWML